MYAIIRVDKRFWIPNHAHGPGDYSGEATDPASTPSSGIASSVFTSPRKGSIVFRVLSEEHVFDEMTPEEEAECMERSRTRRSSSATTRTWTQRAMSRTWTGRTNSGDVEAQHGNGHTIDSVAKPAAVANPNSMDSELSTDSE